MSGVAVVLFLGRGRSNINLRDHQGVMGEVTQIHITSKFPESGTPERVAPPPSSTSSPADAVDSLISLAPGDYTVRVYAEVAFLMTFGFETLALANAQTSNTCSFSTPQIPYVDYSKKDWTLPPSTLSFKQNYQGSLLKHQIKLAVASVVHLEAGSNYLVDHPRLSVKIAEGSMSAEQRGYMVGRFVEGLVVARSLLSVALPEEPAPGCSLPFRSDLEKK